jgi:hypothetical protein
MKLLNKIYALIKGKDVSMSDVMDVNMSTEDGISDAQLEPSDGITPISENTLDLRLDRLEHAILSINEKVHSVSNNLDLRNNMVGHDTIDDGLDDDYGDIPEYATGNDIKNLIKKREEKILKKVEQRLDAREHKKAEERKNYEKQYLKNCEELLLRSGDPDDIEAYRKLIDTSDTTYNKFYTGDANMDFAKNLYNLSRDRIKSHTVSATGSNRGKTHAVNVPASAQRDPVKRFDRTKLPPTDMALAALLTDDQLLEMYGNV